VFFNLYSKFNTTSLKNETPDKKNKKMQKKPAKMAGFLN
jgi:hypothetical protein